MKLAAALNAPAQQRRRPVTILSVAAPEVRRDGQHERQAQRVGPCERAAWIVHTDLHGRVEVLDAAYALIDGIRCLVYQQTDGAQDDESRQQSEGKSAEQELDKADRQEQDLQPEGQQPSQQPGESSGGFVGSQGQDSGEYLQKDGNPESGFAEQGQGAPEQGDIERGTERSQDSDSDIEGSSDNS